MYIDIRILVYVVFYHFKDLSLLIEGLYIYVYICINMFVYENIYKFACTYTWISTFSSYQMLNPCSLFKVYLYICMSMNMFVHIHICIHICIFIFLYRHTYICVYGFLPFQAIRDLIHVPYSRFVHIYIFLPF